MCDEVCSETYCQLYHPEQINSGKEDAANNYACGKYTIGKVCDNIIQFWDRFVHFEIVLYFFIFAQKTGNLILDRIGKLDDNCTGPKGFLLFHANKGGTGSGMGSFFLERLSVDYSHKSKYSFTVSPSLQVSNFVIENYNSVLSTHALLKHTVCTLCLDNEALCNVCNRNLYLKHTTYTNLNCLIAEVISLFAAILCFDSALNVNVTEFQTNILPHITHAFIVC